MQEKSVNRSLTNPQKIQMGKSIETIMIEYRLEIEIESPSQWTDLKRHEVVQIRDTKPVECPGSLANFGKAL